MASVTETALLAIYAGLTVLANAEDPVIPLPLRNEDLAARLVEISESVKAYLNLWDGGQNNREEYLGADVIENGYGIEHEAKLEWCVCGGADDAAREAAYDDGLAAIFDVLKEDRTLGGTVDFADIGALQGPGSGLVTDGVPHAKGVIIPIVLTFRSSRPF